MLVLEGRPVELDAHLDRLEASLSQLFGAALPRNARQAVLNRARAVRHGKLRLTVVPSRPALATAISTTEVAQPLVFPDGEAAVALRSAIVEDGLGAHKWADRSLLERIEAEAPGAAVPLLVDRDDRVLEASRGSVFAVSEGGLLTPPADGRILPSIARRRVIEVALAQGIETRETSFTLAELKAGEAFLAGSVRGIEPVGSVDESGLPVIDRIAARIANGLKRRWLRVPRAESAAVVAVGRRAGRPAR